MKYMKGQIKMSDRICAIATPYGVGAISIIRTSGENCIEYVNKIFKGKSLETAKGYTIRYGYIVDGTQIIDEVLVSIFRGPRSFTAEDSVEISCHGGIFSTNKVLETLLKNGFRMARRGEFSERAYLNKRIDLTEAEAIMDIISANNMTSLKAATMSLRHSTKNLVCDMREKLLNLIAAIEVNIDYPEYDDAVVVTKDLLVPKLSGMIEEMKRVLEKSRISKIAIHGIKTGIVGRPNVGKSSLLNMLIEEDKAIVSHIPGTTRDTVEASITFGNVTLNLVDTAGIRQSEDYVEKIGIKKSIETIKEAELILLVLDSSNVLDPEDLKLLELTKDKKRIIIVNKNDLDQKLDLDLPYISISAKNKKGLSELEDEILHITKIEDFNVETDKYFSNVRHIALLEQALQSLKSAYNAAKNLELVDMIEIDIKDAFEYLGEIIGESGQDILINQLFKNFCLGK